ncbi:lipin, N-terminal conserved region [Nesidiocoris tenuis]|uniref:phosphatidate phosphatase n=1 Tax=Nesidiocoris tenuis TaxID=355587 RepID=A0ABN7AH30_9HEMI|nr:lipin, N-terminal conserved region [Nesidiocoris tenuis]
MPRNKNRQVEIVHKDRLFIYKYVFHWIRCCLKMNYIERVLNNCKYIYNEINAATLTGAIDVIVIEQPDGTYTCSPFHVRFGKLGVLRSKEKIVDIEINGEPVDIHMKLGESGEAFFVEEVECGEGDEEPIPPHLACSPIPPDHGYLAEWPSYDEGHVDGSLDGNNSQENLPPAAGAVSTPKTFRAETLGTDVQREVVRKLSTSSRLGDFRPITGQASETSLSSQDSEFNKEDSVSADERVNAGNNIANTNGKRKRRKKSTKKKNAQKRGSVVDIVPEGKNASDAIFQMEDITGEEQPLKVAEERQIEITTPLNVPQSSESRDIHFFSDTEITPGSSPRDGHDFAPVQSDTEFETSKRTTASETNPNAISDDQPQSWRWGELPTSNIEDNKQESQKWMLQNMLGFMKKTKHIRHKSNDGTEGIYLSDLNSDDPEMAALYLPKACRQPTNVNEFVHEEGREEDAESGNGPSLPQSPHSVEGSICGPKILEVDFGKWYRDDMALSLCGPNATAEQFADNLVSHNQLALDPVNIMSNPKLVVRMDGKIFPWNVAAPMLLSMAIFHKPLPQDTIEKIGGASVVIDIKEDQSKLQKKSSSSYSWFNWSRPSEQQQQQQQQQPAAAAGLVENNEVESTVKTEPEAKESEAKTTDSKPSESVDNAEQTVPQMEPSKPKRPDSMDLTPPVQDAPLDLSTQSRNGVRQTGVEDKSDDHNNSDKYRKTLRLTSDEIARLKLNPGANEIEFSVTTAYQGTSKCKCFLFCWRYDDKIVVSDIDGTITKSDVLGHILPIVGKDWAQSGVAKLFTKIKENGYKLLYLSARAIGQSRVTRDYLKSIKQEEMRLPEGPMLLNPTSLLNAFHTEVIEKKPEEFKISCLKDIQALFPPHISPFYAGYGNKINDVWAYQAVGIPIFRIFTINHRGELKHELTQTFQSTYTNMSQLVDQMFPANNRVSSEDFSQFAWWREPIADISLELSSQST